MIDTTDIIEGSDVTVFVRVDGNLMDVGCGKGCVFQFNNEIIGKTSFNSGLFPKRRVRMSDCKAQVSGITRRTNLIQISGFYFLIEGVRRSELEFVFVFTDRSGGEMIVTMISLIEAEEISGNQGEFSQFNLSLTSTGGFTMSEMDSPVAPDGFVIRSDWWLSVDGLDYLDVGSTPSDEKGYTLTADDVILEVDRSGIQYDEVAGTPGNRQYHFNTGTLQVEFAPNPANPFNPGETVFILFLRPI